MKSLRLTRPHAIMMVGIPGSGKSFFAEQFASMFNAPYIDSLTIEERAKTPEAAGELMALYINEIAKTEETFVFEGDTDSRTKRTEFARWAKSKGYKPVLIWVQTDKATSKARSVKHNGLAPEVFDDIIKDFSPPHPDEKAIVISGKHTYATQAKVVLGHLAKEAEARRATPKPPARSITVK